MPTTRVCRSWVISPSMSLPTRWMPGWAASCSSWMPRAVLPVWQAARRIISPPMVSCGATRCITGRIINRLDMHGGSSGCAMPWASTTCCASTTSGASIPTGPSLPTVPPPRPASGKTAPAWSCSTRWSRRWASCPSLPRTWASCSPACGSCWPTALSRA